MADTLYLVPPEVVDALVRDALKCLLRPVRVDELDCRKSFQRCPTDVPLAEAMELARNAGEPWTFIFRQGFGREPAYAELGCRINGTQRDLFIWIEVSEANGRTLAERHRLTARV